MNVKIKKLHENAVIPTYAKEGDAGLDLVCTSVDFNQEIITYKTGLAIEIPKGYVGLLYPRSSIYKYDLSLTNSVGVIDSGYRGEIMMKYAPNTNYYIDHDGIYRYMSTESLDGNPLNFYQVGDKIGQLIIMPYPQIEFEEVQELSNTERGIGGWGSTGN